MNDHSETSSITAALREAADLLDQHPELPTPRVSVTFHRCSDEDITAIVAALPDLQWRAQQGHSTDWIETHLGRLDITAFADDPTDRSKEPRLAALIPVRA